MVFAEYVVASRVMVCLLLVALDVVALCQKNFHFLTCEVLSM